MEDDIKFEKALDQLEKIVTDLESGDLALDEALKRYEEGVKLSRACTKKLSETEKKIEFLTRALNEAGDAEHETSASKKSEKKKPKKTLEEPDPDFLL